MKGGGREDASGEIETASLHWNILLLLLLIQCSSFSLSFTEGSSTTPLSSFAAAAEVVKKRRENQNKVVMGVRERRNQRRDILSLRMSHMS